MSLSLLLLGFVMGMRHAVEADHLAAMATLANRTHDFRSTAIQGAAWGTGHTITLFLFAGIALLLGGMIPDNYASFLELLVGVMLVGLGLDVLRQLYRRKIHFHLHRHADGVQHLHAHSHHDHKTHDHHAHQHSHAKGLPKRALVIGLMHGMAGSAALVVLTAQNTQNAAIGCLYILLFGLGSILGMALLSLIIVIPLRRFHQRGFTRIYQGMQIAIALFTIGLGSMVVWENQAFLSRIL